MKKNKKNKKDIILFYICIKTEIIEKHYDIRHFSLLIIVSVVCFPVSITPCNLVVWKINMKIRIMRRRNMRISISISISIKMKTKFKGLSVSVSVSAKYNLDIKKNCYLLLK